MPEELNSPPIRLDLRGPQVAKDDNDLTVIQRYLHALIGEPFLFARVSYGDELTLHFGKMQEAKSKKLKDRRMGSHILLFRASPWIYKSTTKPVLIESGLVVSKEKLGEHFQPISVEDLERNFIGPRATVLGVRPHQYNGGICFEMDMSDGSYVIILPHMPGELTGVASVAESTDGAVSSWEFLMPFGDVIAGPGMRWEYAPRPAA